MRLNPEVAGSIPAQLQISINLVNIDPLNIEWIEIYVEIREVVAGGGSFYVQQNWFKSQRFQFESH